VASYVPRTSFRVWFTVSVLACALIGAGCGSSTSASAPSTSASSVRSSTTPASALPRSDELQAYCNWAYRYSEVVPKIDWSDSKRAIAGLEIAAEIVRRRAESAPREIRAANRNLVTSNDEFIRQLRQRAPSTSEELRTAANEAQIALNKEFPNLEHDTAVVAEFDQTNCGIQGA
jgi:hypothetical protein